VAIRILNKSFGWSTYFSGETDCHNQSADWFRNDVGYLHVLCKHNYSFGTTTWDTYSIFCWAL